MIARQQADRWILFLQDDQETEIMRVRLPPGGATAEEIELFIAHLIKLVEQQQHGAN